MLGRRGGDLSGRAAAAARHRPRPGDAAEDPGAGRADEGIQPSIIKDIGRAIRYLRDSTGWRFCLWNSILTSAESLSDHVYIMDRGEIVHDGPAETLDTPEARVTSPCEGCARGCRDG